MNINHYNKSFRTEIESIRFFFNSPLKFVNFHFLPPNEVVKSGWALYLHFSSKQIYIYTRLTLGQTARLRWVKRQVTLYQKAFLSLPTQMWTRYVLNSIYFEKVLKPLGCEWRLIVTDIRFWQPKAKICLSFFPRLQCICCPRFKSFNLL